MNILDFVSVLPDLAAASLSEEGAVHPLVQDFLVNFRSVEVFSSEEVSTCFITHFHYKALAFNFDIVIFKETPNRTRTLSPSLSPSFQISWPAWADRLHADEEGL